MRLIIHPSSTIPIENVDDLRKRSVMFDNLFSMVECPDTDIPIYFRYPDIVEKYINYKYNDETNISISELIKYLEFVMFIIDNEAIKNISRKIIQYILTYDNDIPDDILPDVEAEILNHLQIPAWNYFYYKYEVVRDSAEWMIHRRGRNLSPKDFKNLIRGAYGIAGGDLSFYDSSITTKYVKENINNKDIDWFKLSNNPAVTSEIVDANLHLNWNWGRDGLSSNYSVANVKFITKHLDKPWYWGESGISYYGNINDDFVIKHINKPWNWGVWGLSRNHRITEKLVEQYIDEPWEWNEFGLSCRRDFSESIIEKAIQNIKPLSFNMMGLTENNNISIEFIEKYMDRNWSWSNLKTKPKRFTSIQEYKEYILSCGFSSIEDHKEYLEYIKEYNNI